MSTYLCSEEGDVAPAQIQDINPTFAAQMYARRQWPQARDGEIHDVHVRNMATSEEEIVRVEAVVIRNWKLKQL